MQIDFERMFKISITAMKINMSHPDVPRDKKWMIKFGCLHGLFSLVFLVMFYNFTLGIKTGNYSVACRHFILNVIFYIVSIQYFVLIAHQKTIAEIMEMMKVDYAQDIPHDEQKIVLEYATKGKKLCFLWLAVVIYTGMIFPLKHLVLELYTYIIDDWRLIEAYPLTYPSPIEEHKMQPLVYTLINLILLSNTVYSSLMYVAFVPLGPILMLHACGQLEIAKKRALALYVDSAIDVEDRIKEIVKLLQYVYSFIDRIGHVFGVVYELTLQGTSIILPLTLYEVLHSWRIRGEFSIEFVTFILGGTLLSSSFCYYSDKLMEKGEEVRLAIYSCGWERRYDHGVRTTLMVILLRAQQPTAIRTMFRTLCLDALADVFHQSYAIFSLMNAAW